MRGAKLMRLVCPFAAKYPLDTRPHTDLITVGPCRMIRWRHPLAASFDLVMVRNTYRLVLHMSVTKTLAAATRSV